MSSDIEAIKVLEFSKITDKMSLGYNELIRDMERYNTADGPNMTPDEMNKFRHNAASAFYVSKGIPESIVSLLGMGKEGLDFLKKHGWTDSSFDLRNNKRGREIGRMLKYSSQKAIFDYIFLNDIKPNRRK